MVGFLITIVVLAIALWIVTLLPTGVEVDSPLKALLAGAVIGILTGLYHLFPGWLRTFGGLVSLGLIPLIVSVIIFGLAAWLIEGFRLKWGIISAVLGAIALTFINSILTWLLEIIVPAVV